MNIFKRLCFYILRDELASFKIFIVNQQAKLKNEITDLEAYAVNQQAKLKNELAALKAYIVNQQDELKRLKLENTFRLMEWSHQNKKEIEKMQADREFHEGIS